MIEYLASGTRFAESATFSADLLEEALLFLAAPQTPVLFVVDPRPFPVRDRALRDLGGRREIHILDRVVPNPASADIMAMAETARELKPAAVIGIGGGSTLDSAKAVALLLANDGDLDEYLGAEATRKPASRGPTLFLVPTTTGTGSEATRFGVYTNRAGRKCTLASPLLQADAAWLCDALVADLPPPLVAATGYDALTHALETLWNRTATPASDALAQRAAAAVLRGIEPAWREAGDPSASGAARAALLRAAALAGIAFNVTGTAAIHALSFVVSEEWHLSHGAACAFFTEDVFDLNSADPAVRAKLVRLGRSVLVPVQSAADDRGVLAALRTRLVGLKNLMGLPSRFNDIPGFIAPPDPRQREALLSRFDKTQNDPKLKNNRVALDQDRVRALVAGKMP